MHQRCHKTCPLEGCWSSQTRLLASGAVDCSLQSGPSTESKQQVFDLCNCAYMLYPWPRRKDEPLSSAALRFPVPEMRDWSQMAAVAAGLGASLLLVLRPRILLARLGGALRSGGLAGLTGVTGLPAGLSGLAEAGCTGCTGAVWASASGWSLRQCDSTLRNFYSSLSLSVPRTLRAGMLCSLFTLQTSIGPYRSQDASNSHAGSAGRCISAKPNDQVRRLAPSRRVGPDSRAAGSGASFSDGGSASACQGWTNFRGLIYLAATQHDIMHSSLADSSETSSADGISSRLGGSNLSSEHARCRKLA